MRACSLGADPQLPGSPSQSRPLPRTPREMQLGSKAPETAPHPDCSVSGRERTWGALPPAPAPPARVRDLGAQGQVGKMTCAVNERVSGARGRGGEPDRRGEGRGRVRALGARRGRGGRSPQVSRGCAAPRCTRARRGWSSRGTCVPAGPETSAGRARGRLAGSGGGGPMSASRGSGVPAAGRARGGGRDSVSQAPHIRA